MNIYRIISMIVVMVAILVAVGAVGYSYANKRFSALERDYASTTAMLTELSAAFNTYGKDNDAANLSLSDRMYETAKTVNALSESVDSQVGKLSGSVKTLEKLSTTDPELLRKYSKIYFLNENYKPAGLTIIDQKYDLVNGKEVAVNTDILSFLNEMLHAATDDGVDLMVLSGYRSFADQSTLKSSYKVRYGTGANQFSADQGYSEHQLGTALDFTTQKDGEDLGKFKDSPANTWLTEHAYKYGFVLSYPEGNAYYMYEPWHWRFVGKSLATYLHDKGLHFYDLEQREIDGYLVSLFD